MVCAFGILQVLDYVECGHLEAVYWLWNREKSDESSLCNGTHVWRGSDRILRFDNIL